METLRLLAILEPAPAVAGPGKLLLDFASLARDGRFGPAVETTIAEFRDPGDPSIFREAGRAVGVPVVGLSKWNRWDRKVVPELVSLIRDLKPDIVQTDALLSHFVARVAGVPRLAPWVAFHHGYTWPDLRTRVLYNQADRWSLRAATRVFTVCDAFRNQLSRRGIPERRIDVVHNAIDPQWGANVREGAAGLRASLAIPPGRKVILSVGRLSREKGHVTVVEALARLHREGAPETHLLIVGEGPERRRIEARARSLGISAHLTLAGRVRAKPYYGVADVFALPSLSEGSPLCLLEAMATGVPIAATRVGGIPEMVRDRETVLLVPASDSAALARALLELLRNPHLARSLSAQAAILVQNRFSPEARARQIVALYRGVLHAGERPGAALISG